MLHVPTGSNTFGSVQPSTTARPAAAQGTSVTAAVGSKGAWTQMIASTTADSYGVLICINSGAASAASRNRVVDIGIGPAASEQVLIPDLIGGNAGTYAQGGLWYYFPVFVPAGTRLSARAQGSVTTAFRVFTQLLQKPANPSQVRKASFIEAYGITAPGGTALTAGTTSDGSWTLVGTTTNRVWWWQFGAQVNTADTAHITAAAHFDVAAGDGTNFDVLIQDAQFITSTSETAGNPPLSAGVEFSVPAGTNIYVRAQSSGTPDPYNVAVYAAGG